MALALYFMFATLGAAVGLSVSDRVRPSSLQTGAVIWSVLTLCISIFVGGVMASLFTVGENKVESIFYGVIMWAFLLFVFLCMAAFGVGSGISGTVGLARVAQASGPEWEASAEKPAFRLQQSTNGGARPPTPLTRRTTRKRSKKSKPPRRAWPGTPSAGPGYP